MNLLEGKRKKLRRNTGLKEDKPKIIVQHVENLGVLVDIFAQIGKVVVAKWSTRQKSLVLSDPGDLGGVKNRTP